MRPLTILFAAAAAASSLACGAPSADDGAVGSTGAAERAACSSAYWSWVMHDLRPRLAKPVDEVSEDELLRVVAAHPPVEENASTYGTCWQPLFAEHFFAGAAHDLHQAHVTFIDRTSPDFRSYARYQANATMSPMLRRNAKALLALRPASMSPTDMLSWSTSYEAFLTEVVEPVAIPGPSKFEDVVEEEWDIDAPEAEYLAVVEAARAEPSKDGVYGEWVPTFGRWLFGPQAGSRSIVFNLPFEPGAESESYGLSGVVLESSGPVLPPKVEAFVKRLAATRPAAIGAQDSAAWMSRYDGRALRALGDLSQKEPMVTATDLLALDVLERVRPTTLRGLATYETWLDLMKLAKDRDASWATRFRALEPCVDAADLDAAKSAFDESATALGEGVGAPRLCAD